MNAASKPNRDSLWLKLFSPASSETSGVFSNTLKHAGNPLATPLQIRAYFLFVFSFQLWNHTKDGELKHKSSGVCLQSKGANTDVVVGACRSGEISQRWKFSLYFKS